MGPVPPTQPDRSFPTKYGSTILLLIGAALVIAAIAAAFVHPWVAGGMATVGVTAIVVAIVIDRTEGTIVLPGFRGNLRSTTHSDRQDRFALESQALPALPPAGETSASEQVVLTAPAGVSPQ